MTTRRDLLEMHAYERRRQLAALLPGTDPSRPGRALLGGIALAILLVAGLAVRALLAPGLPTGWDQPGLVVVPETGERFLITERGGPLHPLGDLASAQLALGADVTPRLVPAAALAGHPRGPAVGIAGGPQRLPTGHTLIQGGWSACTADGAGVAVTLTRTPAVVASPGRGVVVTTDGIHAWLVAADAAQHAWRYSVPERTADALLARIALPAVAQAVRVPASWLALFPDGGGLTPETWVRAHWAATTLQPLASPVCAELVTSVGAASVRLATLPAGAAWVTPGAGQVTRTVDPGAGALVASGPHRWVVDDRGAADPIDGQDLTKLGLGQTRAARVPPSWLALLARGVALSVRSDLGTG